MAETQIVNPCLGWQFNITQTAVGRSSIPTVAVAEAYLNARGLAQATADTVCGTPLGCTGWIHVDTIHSGNAKLVGDEYEVEVTIGCHCGCGHPR